MRKFICSIFLLLMCVSPAAAFEITDIAGPRQGLDFVAQTGIPGSTQDDLALCHVTENITVLGYDLTTFITGYALAENDCISDMPARLFSADDMVTAQSLKLIDPTLPVTAKTSRNQLIWNYGLYAAVIIFLLLVALSKLRAIFGTKSKKPLRVKAAGKVVQAMCHAAKCDGHVAHKEVNVIIQTAKRLTGHMYDSADVMRMADKADLQLTVHDYIAFGKGLRDREKEAMLHAVIYVIIADGRMLPAEYEFATELSNGLGMPAPDFNRMLEKALVDMEKGVS